jgi:hypothetical protein
MGSKAMTLITSILHYTGGFSQCNEKKKKDIKRKSLPFLTDNTIMSEEISTGLQKLVSTLGTPQATG